MDTPFLSLDSIARRQANTSLFARNQGNLGQQTRNKISEKSVPTPGQIKPGPRKNKWRQMACGMLFAPNTASTAAVRVHLKYRTLSTAALGLTSCPSRITRMALFRTPAFRYSHHKPWVAASALDSKASENHQQNAFRTALGSTLIISAYENESQHQAGR